MTDTEFWKWVDENVIPRGFALGIRYSAILEEWEALLSFNSERIFLDAENRQELYELIKQKIES